MALSLLAACGSGSGGGTSSADQTTLAPDTTTSQDHSSDHEEEHHDHDHNSDSESHTGEDEDDRAPVEVDEARRLLVVAALEQPTLDLIDLADGGSVTIGLRSPASLGSSMTEDQRFVLAAHEDGVTIVDSGVWSEAHGNHFHHYSSTPHVLGQVTGPDPSHLVSHHGVTALYFDGAGEAVVIDEEALADGTITTVATVNTGAPHHGFAVPTGDSFVVTVPTEGMDQLPDVVGVANPAGQIQARFDCPLAHGEAGLSQGASVACGDGILMVTLDDGIWSGTHLTYPETTDQDPYGYGPARSWVLAVSPNTDLIAAPYGSRHVLVVDRVSSAINAFDMREDVATLGVAFHSSGALVVLTLDGSVMLVDPADGSVMSSVEAIGAFREGEPDEPYRLLTVSADMAYVSDPATGQVVEISLAGELSVDRRIDLGFAPSFIAIANG